MKFRILSGSHTELRQGTKRCEGCEGSGKRGEKGKEKPCYACRATGYEWVPVTYHGPNRGNPTGDIFDSDADLCALYNKTENGMPVPAYTKFERVDDLVKPTGAWQDQAVAMGWRPPENLSDKSVEDSPPVVTSDGLDDLNVEELRALAAEEEIELPVKARKDEILSAIRSAKSLAPR